MHSIVEAPHESQSASSKSHKSNERGGFAAKGRRRSRTLCEPFAPILPRPETISTQLIANHEQRRVESSSLKAAAINRGSHLQPGHDPTRDKAGCGAILHYFRSLPPFSSDRECPSSLELIRDGRFGQRPVNRINDLVLGKFDGHRYDFERIRCGRGEYRWRLHEPARPGHPKDSKQTVLQPADTDGRANDESDFIWRRRMELAQSAPLFASAVRP
jgi:hypothetical protein